MLFHVPELLCKIDQSYGIVSARHVWFNLVEKHQEIKIIMRNGLHTLKKGYLKAIYPPIHGTIYDCEVPDIVFICLPPNEGPVFEDYGKIFYSIDKRLTDQGYDLYGDDGYWATFGSPSKLLGREKRKAPSLVYCTELKEKYERDGWDYLALDLNLEEGEQIPEDVRGMSGGGIWRTKFSMAPNLEAFVIENVYRDIIFSGVNFCQTRIEKRHSKIIGHGPKSIYQCLVDLVKGL